MKEHPILFSKPMVCAIFDDRKGQTRRPMKPQPHPDFLARGLVSVVAQCPRQDGFRWFMRDGCSELVASRFRPGDRLWVKEAWRTMRKWDDLPPRDIPHAAPVQYEAGGVSLNWPSHPQLPLGRYRHSRFMPRWASRLTLEITSVRVEQLQSITPEDADAEGFDRESDDYKQHGPSWCFMDLWDKLNGETFPWASNPWVYVIAFKRVKS